MTEQEILELRQENIRQREIIEQLLEFNRVLRNQIAIGSKEIGTNKLLSSTPETWSGRIGSNDSIPRVEIGIKSPVYSISQSESGTNGNNDSNQRTDRGINEVDDSMPRAERGIKQSLYSIPRAENHGKGILSDAGMRINDSPGNVLAITQRIKTRKLLLLSKKKGAQMVKLLIHINNKEAGTAAAMCRATGYSKSGLAKTLMNLRKKGIVIKHGVRNYELTGKALILMEGLQ